MDRAFLDLYEEELRFVREMGVEFAKSHPKIAGRLALGPDEVPDPYTERLLEGFAFLTARVRLRMESQYPEFTQSLLGLLYPNLTAQTPSATVFELEPEYSETALVDGFTVQSGASIIGRVDGVETPCEFTTTSDVTLRPLIVDEVEYSEQPTLIQRWLPGTVKTEAAIRLRFRQAVDAPLDSLNLDPLSLYIAGTGALPDRILQALIMDRTSMSVHPADPSYEPSIGRELEITQQGFGDDEALIPQSAKTFSGHRLLQEAFIMPEKFRFVTIGGLERSVKGYDARVFDVIIGLREAIPEFVSALTKDMFRLHCVPAVNLFTRRADRIAITGGQSEHQVIVDRTRPMGYEVYDVINIAGINRTNNNRYTFAPIFKPDQEQGKLTDFGYFSAHRRLRLVSDTMTETPYLGTDVYVRLNAAGGGPAPMGIDQLLVQTLCTNRGMAMNLSRKSKYTLQSAVPITKLKSIVGPTTPRLPLANGAAGWNLVNALSLNHLSFSGDEATNAGWLRRMLTLFSDTNSEVQRQMVTAYDGLSSKVINRRLPGDGPLNYGRGLQITLNADTDRLRGTGPFVIASVLERFFMRAATLNSFTQTVLTSSNELELAKWPVRTGGRHVL